jgi:hypothetical protein
MFPLRPEAQRCVLRPWSLGLWLPAQHVTRRASITRRKNGEYRGPVSPYRSSSQTLHVTRSRLRFPPGPVSKYPAALSVYPFLSPAHPSRNFLFGNSREKFAKSPKLWSSCLEACKSSCSLVLGHSKHMIIQGHRGN